MNRYLHPHRYCFSLLQICSRRGGGSVRRGPRARILLPSSSLTSLSSRFLVSSSTKRSKTEEPKFYLQSLQILERCRPKRVKKTESFVKRSFFGELDADYLHFPHLVESKEEEVLLSAQYDYIRRHFISICSDRQEMISRGLFDTSQMTTFELVHFFEAIGASLNYVRKGEENSSNSNSNYPSKQLIPIGSRGQLLVTDSFLATYHRQKTFLEAVVPLILHNALVTRALTGTGNSVIQERFSQGDKTLVLPNSIAFAFCELNDRLAALPYPFWDSIAVYSKEDRSWTLSGSKRRILKNNFGYEKYLIFCRTLKDSSSKSTSTADNGIATFLVDRADLQSVESDGTDNYGTEYERISFKGLRLSRDEHELYPEDSKEDQNQTLATNFALNLKATGQLATAAVIHGLLKEAVVGNLMTQFRNGKYTGYKSLFNQTAFRLHTAVYSLESELYLTAGHFDSFWTDQVDGLHLQAAATKTLATELAAQSVADLRHLLDPHQLEPVISSQTTDVLNVLDGLLDSATSSRMLLGMSGLATVGAWKFDHIAKLRLMNIYFNHLLAFVTFKRFRESKLYRSPQAMEDLKKLQNLEPELQKSAQHLKDSLKEVAGAADQILTIFGREAVCNQIDINRLATCVLALYQMVAVMARANDRLKKFGDKEGHSANEVLLCTTICREKAKKIAAETQLIFGVLSTSEDKRARSLHKMNIQFGGYFPKPTFDRII